MALKLYLDSNKIFHKEFTASNPGYDSLQVDTFLDLVIKDYDSFEKFEADAQNTIKELNTKINLLNSQLTEAETENATLKSKLSGISDNHDAGLNNLELLKRINTLEKALNKAGINPNTID